MKKNFDFIVFIIIISLFGCGTQDQDGNSFSTIKIGSQIWMVENLNVEHYRNGDIIPEVQDKNRWANLEIGAWCYYENDPAKGKKYGKLYNWYAVNDPRGLAPEGWHIPTKPEFETLITIVNGNGNSLKAIGQGIGNGAGTNTSGLSALLAGTRHYNGSFGGLGVGGSVHVWSSTERDASHAYELYLDDDDSTGSFLDDLYSKENGFSVRCVKD